MKHKIQGRIPDLDLYDTFVNNLKLDPEVKNSYKAKIKAQIEEETADAKAKTEKVDEKMLLIYKLQIKNARRKFGGFSFKTTAVGKQSHKP